MKLYFRLFVLLIFFVNVIYAQLKPSVEWVKIYDGIGRSIDMTNDAKMDKEFNLYLAGRSAGVDGSQDLLILKYSRFGKLISEIRYVSAPASWEEANSIAVDSSNNLYCIGSASFGTSSDFAIIQKYSSNGSMSWSKNFYNTSDHYSEGIKITVDKENNVIAGYHLNGASFTKYTSSGDSLWTVKISDNTSKFAINDIITDASSNIYAAITQSYYGGSDVPYTLIHTYKYDKNGNHIWHKIFNGIYTKKMVFDKDNNILQLVINSKSGIIIKLSQTGEVELQKDSGILILTDVGVDQVNNIIVTGYDVTSNSFDYFTKKYTSNGIDKWTQIFNSAENLKDYASALAIDSSNNIYVTGSSHNSVSQGISYTIKYSDNGELLWQQKFDAPHSIFENSNFLFLDDSSNVFVGGDVADSTNGWNFFALKITHKLGTNIEQQKSFLPTEYSLKQNYPNPFNPSTRIEFSIPKSSFVKLEIFDALGREVKELINQYLSVGSYSVNFNAQEYSSGIYYYRLSTNEITKIKKAVLLK
jgi:hypothetical protein